MGVSGECVIPAMAARLRTVLSNASKKYDWIIILGGMSMYTITTVGRPRLVLTFLYSIFF